MNDCLSDRLTRLSDGPSERGVPLSEFCEGLGVCFVGAKCDTQMTLHKNEDNDNDNDEDDDGDDNDDGLCELDNNDFKCFQCCRLFWSVCSP